MIRQAHTYLVSAMSGATLIAIAIVAFVLLVSAQVFRDWPIAALGDNETAHISDSRAASAPEQAATTTAAEAISTAQHSTGARSGGGAGAGAGKTQVSSGDLAPVGAPTATTSPVDSGDAGSGGNQGSGAPSPSPAQNPSGSASNQSSSSSGGSSGSGSSTASTPTGKLTETVNNTVNGVDQTVTGGALGKTGVTEVTENVVDGVVGPESAVGKVVDETVGAVGKTVGGLLGGNR